MNPLMVREAVIEYRGRASGTVRVGSSADVVRWAGPLIGNRVQESFLVAALDARNRVQSYAEIGRGSMVACPVSMVDVLRFLVLAGCPACVLVHNHPSGDPAPSAEDDALTSEAAKACRLLGLRVLDHVIVAGDASFSYLDSGRMP